MTAAEWERIKAIFDAALNVPRDERACWLEQACDGCPELRGTVEQLLRSWDESTIAGPVDIEQLPVFSPGQIVANRFRVLRLIARGGMGEVYEAQDASLDGLRIALKTIRTDIASEKHAYERFKREVWVAREVAHEGICRIFDLVEHRETNGEGVERVVPCLTMQLLDGYTLSSLLGERRPLSTKEALPLITQMVLAIQVMHANGIVHRDIKPSNIMLVHGSDGGDCRVVILDFGLAKPLHEGSVRWQTRSEERAGAPYFIAPEVLRGERGGIAVDVYALGLIIDEMVTRSPAFPCKSVEEVFWNKLHGEPIRPSARAENLPPSWEQTILRCLDRDPNRRPERVVEVLSFLNGSSDITVTLPALPPSPAAPPTESGSATPGRESIFSRLARLTWRWWLGIAIGSILLTLCLALVLGSTPPNLPTSILVYPFVNLTKATEYNYLCTGIAEELMRRLLHIQGVHVYLFHEAQSLGSPGSDEARFSVKASLQYHDQWVWLTVQLFDTKTRKLVWTERFNRELRNPLELESEIAQEIVAAMVLNLQKDGRSSNQVQLTFQSLGAHVRRWFGYDVALLPAQATSNRKAFIEYSRGRELLQKRTEGETRQAIRHFLTATILDPKYALAYAALADAQHVLLTWSNSDRKLRLTEARKYAEQAVALDPSLPEVHTSLAAVRQALWDWEGSEWEYQKALTVQPKFARAHHWFAGLLLQFGRFDEALAHAREALELEPYDWPSHSSYGLYLWHAGRLREAATHLEGLLTKEPDFPYGHMVLGQVYAALAASSSEPEATDFFVRSLREAGVVRAHELKVAGGTDSAGFLKWSDTVFAQAHASRQDWASVRLYTDRLERGLKSKAVPASLLARAYAVAGRHTRALELLELGLKQNEREMLYINVAPFFKPLHRYERFQTIVRLLGLDRKN
jgi:serine/threonine-protein kinase